MKVRGNVIFRSNMILSMLFASLLLLPGTGTVSFASDQLSQCANDPDNSGTIEMCKWVTGALTTVNSRYAESDGVPQRWFFTHVPATTSDTHTATFKYTFTKNSIYAFDFLTDVNHSMPLSLINPCGDLPPFVSPDDCVSAFGAAVDVPLQSDPFDAVSLREHPPMRNALFGCWDTTTNTSCTINSVSLSTPVHIPNTNCFQNCGDSDIRRFTSSGRRGRSERHSGQIKRVESMIGWRQSALQSIEVYYTSSFSTSAAGKGLLR